MDLGVRGFSLVILKHSILKHRNLLSEGELVLERVI